MIEIVGGPFDGKRYSKNPGRVVFLSANGSFHAKEVAGTEPYLELGVCRDCGVRVKEAFPMRRFVPAEQAELKPCDLCGSTVAL